jgi:ferredoxin-like protein FixX
MKQVSQEVFLMRATEIHPEYDFSASLYTSARMKVKVVCPWHGEFSILPGALFQGVGCKPCGSKSRGDKKRWTTEKFIEKSREVWGADYDYSKSVYIKSQVKLTITCPKHGDFQITPNNHINGHACLECGNARIQKHKADTQDDFLRKAKKSNGDRYDYSKVKYDTSYTDVEVGCPMHGYFWTRPNDHVKGVGCPKCVTNHSQPHKELEEFLFSLGAEFESNTRAIITPKELDIYIPSHKLAIEFNGLYWHAVGPEDSADAKFKHRDKYHTCVGKDILLLQINEHEWKNDNTRSIWKSIISSKLGKHKKVYARETEFQEISRDAAQVFLAGNHLQGSTPIIRWAFGLFHHEILVGVITFAAHEKKEINLNRLAFKRGITVVGGARKLFKNALPYLPSTDIVTFSNNQYSNGAVYPEMGFSKVADMPPSYQWAYHNALWNKRSLRKKFLKKLPDIQYADNKTEHQMLFQAGARCLYDAGYQKWKYQTPTK